MVPTAIIDTNGSRIQTWPQLTNWNQWLMLFWTWTIIRSNINITSLLFMNEDKLLCCCWTQRFAETCMKNSSPICGLAWWYGWLTSFSALYSTCFTGIQDVMKSNLIENVRCSHNGYKHALTYTGCINIRWPMTTKMTSHYIRLWNRALENLFTFTPHTVEPITQHANPALWCTDGSVCTNTACELQLTKSSSAKGFVQLGGSVQRVLEAQTAWRTWKKYSISLTTLSRVW